MEVCFKTAGGINMWWRRMSIETSVLWLEQLVNTYLTYQEEEDKYEIIGSNIIGLVFKRTPQGTTMWMILLHGNIRWKVWVKRSSSGSNRSNESAWHLKPEGACKVEYNIPDNPSHKPWCSRNNGKIGTGKSTPCEEKHCYICGQNS